MAASVERKLYIKQIEQICEEGKKSLMVPSTLINETTDDAELGRLVRKMIEQKIEDCENHVRYMKSL
jgi:hypothetical protein